MKTTIAKSGKSSITGRVYSEESLANIVHQLNSTDSSNLGELYLDGETERDYSSVSIADSAFKYDNVRIENGNIVADIIVLDTPKGNQLTDLLNSGVDGRFSLAYIGKIDKDNNATDLRAVNCLWYKGRK